MTLSRRFMFGAVAAVAVPVPVVAQPAKGEINALFATIEFEQIPAVIFPKWAWGPYVDPDSVAYMEATLAGNYDEAERIKEKAVSRLMAEARLFLLRRSIK